ncbi:hypothetical protein PGT21_023388 [Puccinia graminis f. sp. tritici]|uniref:Uncharacterized protein n=1 Tax=Puccinia graminis f. sp. tritici TaxID=56615 RepID=A0A5B0SGS5_PUCGR|nr:hypothetical protein PGT21_023388 [Puccinia graminis f. sp. tritici]KAA1136443.1 hypothetical protein PGTUg99_031956 [Puccinia graminis f. sp. tritici]
MQFLKSFILMMAIITFQIVIADQAYDQDHRKVFRCPKVNRERPDERIAVCGGASKTDPTKYESQSCINRFILPTDHEICSLMKTT